MFFLLICINRKTKIHTSCLLKPYHTTHTNSWVPFQRAFGKNYRAHLLCSEEFFKDKMIFWNSICHIFYKLYTVRLRISSSIQIRGASFRKSYQTNVCVIVVINFSNGVMCLDIATHHSSPYLEGILWPVAISNLLDTHGGLRHLAIKIIPHLGNIE